MKLCEICIKRPVFATVLSLLLIFGGWLGFENLEMVYMPDVQDNTVTVKYSYPGGSPNYLHDNIITYVESALTTINGIKEISSIINKGNTTTTITLEPSTNIIKATADITSALNGIESTNLPPDIDPPNVTSSKYGQRVMNIGFQAKGANLSQLRDYLTKTIIPQFQRVPGIGPVSIWGGHPYALKIWLDPKKMAAYEVTASDVTSAITNNNLDITMVSIHAQGRDYSFQ